MSDEELVAETEELKLTAEETRLWERITKKRKRVSYERMLREHKADIEARRRGESENALTIALARDGHGPVAVNAGIIDARCPAWVNGCA